MSDNTKKNDLILTSLEIDTKQHRNIYVTGDLHGRKKYLIKELDLIGFDYSKDLLISVGDLIDRGDQDLETLELVKEDWFKACVGNHELFAWYACNHNDWLSCLDYNRTELWFYNGGSWFYNLVMEYYEPEITYPKIAKIVRDCISKMYGEIVVKVGETTAKISHANRFDKSSLTLPLSLQEYNDKEYYKKANDPFWSRDYWMWDKSSETHKNQIFIHGHTPQDKIPTVLKESNVILIDSGVAWKPNKLQVFNIKDLVEMMKEGN